MCVGVWVCGCVGVWVWVGVGVGVGVGMGVDVGVGRRQLCTSRRKLLQIARPKIKNLKLNLVYHQ